MILFAFLKIISYNLSRLKRIEYISGHFKKYRLSSSHTLVIFIFYPLNRPYFYVDFIKIILLVNTNLTKDNKINLFIS